MEESCYSIIVVEDPKWYAYPVHSCIVVIHCGCGGKACRGIIVRRTHNDPTFGCCGKFFLFTTPLSLSGADRDLFFFTTCRSNNNSSGLSTGCDLPLSTTLSRKTSIHLCLPLPLFLMTTLLCFLPMLAWTRHVAPFFQCQKTNTFYSTSLCSWVLSIPTLHWLVLRVLPTRKSVFVQVASTMTWMT